METKKVQEIDEQEGLNKKLKVIFCSLILGLLFNYFFIWDSIGISAVIFNALTIGFALWILYPNINLNKKLNYIFLIPIVLLSLTYCIYNNPFLRTINPILLPFLITGYLISIIHENIKEINICFIKKVFNKIFSLSFKVMPKFSKFTKEIISLKKHSKENSIQKSILNGLLISIPLLFVIVCLLTSADMMFKYYIQNIGNIFQDLDLWSFTGHTIVVVFVVLYMFGFLWSFKYKDIEHTDKSTTKISTTWNQVIFTTIIFAISIVYLLFSIIQFSYLYGGNNTKLPTGVLYSEYARKGFFQLILVTLINLTLVLFSMKLSKKSSDKIEKVSNISYSLLIMFTFNMLFSANYKMNLYEKAFGYTRLRIFVQVFMILLGILLLIVFLGIWNSKVCILKWALASTMIIYIALNFANVDKVIVKNNIERYNKTQKIDLCYIATLSYDSKPALINLLNSNNAIINTTLKQIMESQKYTLKETYNNWYEFNYYKHKFLQLDQ